LKPLNSGRFFSVSVSIAAGIISAMLTACKPDMQTISAYTYKDTLPDLVAHNIEYTRSDSGLVKVVLTAPLLHQYEGDEPYFEFPAGFKVLFYDSSMKASSVMTANYGIGYDYKKIMEAENNVVIINYEKNEELNTERLVWDQKLKRIFSDTIVKITTNEEILYGKGLESDESFNNYEIIKPSGTLLFEDDED